MSIVLWVIVIHLIELISIGGYLLIRKNRTLEKMVIEQQQYMDSISIVIENSDATLKQMDIQGSFEADDEVGIFFKNLKAIQEVLNQFNIRKS
jgi:hypothetical protein